MAGAGGRVRAHGARRTGATVPMCIVSWRIRLGPPSLSTIAWPCPQALPPLAMIPITARRASGLGIRHVSAHVVGMLKTMVGVPWVCVVVLVAGMSELSEVVRALKPACAGRASSSPHPPLLPVPSSTALITPAPCSPLLTFLLGVCVTADLADNITFVTHTHPDACVAAASTSSACGVGVPVAKFVAKRILGTPTSVVCPHAPAKRPECMEPVGASGHISSSSREGQRAYVAADNHNAAMRYAAYVLCLRAAFASLCKGLCTRWGSSRSLVLLADSAAESGDDGVGVHGSLRGSRVFLA